MPQDSDDIVLALLCLFVVVALIGRMLFWEKTFKPPPNLKGIRIRAGEKYHVTLLRVSPAQARAGYYLAILQDPASPDKPPTIERWASWEERIAFHARPAGDLIVCALAYGPQGELLEVTLSPDQFEIDASLLIR